MLTLGVLVALVVSQQPARVVSDDDAPRPSRKHRPPPPPPPDTDQPATVVDDSTPAESNPGLDATEVTVTAYGQCVAAGACSTANLQRSDWGPASYCNWHRPGRERHPMNCVDQAQAATFCAWAGQHLPTDDEWEAALGPSTYPWGEAAPDGTRACVSSLDASGTCPVGSRPPNAEGRYDLAGNVQEWTSTRACPTCTGFINRGGAFSGGWASAISQRFGHLRGVDEAAHRGSYLGFRCASGTSAPVSPARASRAPSIQVDVRVVTREDGTGNEQWSEAFTRRVFERAQSLAHADVRFDLVSFETLENDVMFATKTQPPILDWATSKAIVGHLTVVISQPATSDTAGYARVDSGTKDFKPNLVMRSRKRNQSDADVYECAAIFLHELGHTLGYSHDGTVEAMPWPCDGWWDMPNARVRLATIAGWMELHQRGASKGARAGFKCKVGLPVPDTQQLFDPPTNAPTPEECAQRCLDWPGCVATAQPTWENARCFLYGAGATPLHNNGWNNVDVCWVK
jgi:hypothetical protein